MMVIRQKVFIIYCFITFCKQYLFNYIIQ